MYDCHVNEPWASTGFEGPLQRSSYCAFKCVYVLGEPTAQQALLCHEWYGGVRDSGGELARVQGFRKGVERLWVGAEAYDNSKAAPGCVRFGV
ncbi:hypothetical protein L873DRAFT_1853914 [Choiromyces venosus 120613-1]|uniref:Uncharacterized protein n=1 Tax=Choiromyces venosus 120613-1 TaxID=1336337 RepID=A0A3N4JHQ4_9PEZI|nr:hypothetical protein L873DRAFT_1853914 [Choiromyces venosus 120613-1]